MTFQNPGGLPEGEVACIEACTDCRDRCTELVEAGLDRGAGPRDWALGVLLEDCAELCVLTANFVFRRSARSRDAGLWCARLCLEAAGELSREGQPQGRECTEALLRCAQLCRGGLTGTGARCGERTFNVPKG